MWYFPASMEPTVIPAVGVTRVWVKVGNSSSAARICVPHRPQNRESSRISERHFGHVVAIWLPPRSGDEDSPVRGGSQPIMGNKRARLEGLEPPTRCSEG